MNSIALQLWMGLIVVCLILFLYTGLMLMHRGIKNKQNNFVLLGLSYILMCLLYSVLLLSPNWFLNDLLTLIQYILALLFIRNTFYKGRRSHFKVLIILLIVSWLPIAYLSLNIHILSTFEMTFMRKLLTRLFQNLITILVFGWLGFSSISAMKSLENKDIEPWILKRMKIVGYSSFVVMLSHLPDLLNLNPDVGYLDFQVPITQVIFYLQLGILMFFMLSQFLAWTMPKKLKDYLNRNFEPKSGESIKDITEDEVLRQLMQN